MKLNMLRDNAGATTQRKRVGRGIGSGLGKTCGHGQKGQKSRSGVAIKGFEGGQMPIQMRVPKRGFKRGFVRLKDVAVINTGRIQAAINAQKLDVSLPISRDLLVKAGLVRSSSGGVKMLAKGSLSSKIIIEVNQISASARSLVEGCGGQVSMVGQPQ